MPELPEVETIVRGLQKYLPGKTIQKVAVHREKQLINSTPQSFSDFLYGETFTAVQRFGKYLLFLFAGGKKMVTHLRMTGKFIDPDQLSDGGDDLRHVRIEFYFGDGGRLLYNDPRVFGTFAIYEAGVELPEREKVGPEPFDKSLNGERLYQAAIKRSIAVKVLLLEQKFIAGLGNIYVCESLFMAGVDPCLLSNKVTPGQWQKILIAVRDVLTLAIAKNGTSISDFRGVDDKQGSFQEMLMVYQRAGQKCRRCGGGPIERIRQAQRSTFYCPDCQK